MFFHRFFTAQTEWFFAFQSEIKRIFPALLSGRKRIPGLTGPVGEIVRFYEGVLEVYGGIAFFCYFSNNIHEQSRKMSGEGVFYCVYATLFIFVFVHFLQFFN